MLCAEVQKETRSSERWHVKWMSCRGGRLGMALVLKNNSIWNTVNGSKQWGWGRHLLYAQVFWFRFLFESKGEKGYVNTDFNIENSPFCEVLPVHYLLTDILFLLSQSKSSGKWDTFGLTSILYLLSFLKLRLYQHHIGAKSRGEIRFIDCNMMQHSQKTLWHSS